MTRGEGLGDAHTAGLSRMKTQQGSRSNLGMQVLMWVSHTERPLHVNELCHAGGRNIIHRLEYSEHPCYRNTTGMLSRTRHSREILIYGPLGAVHLVHDTLQEYLSRNSNLFLKPHAMISEVCLTYPNFRQVRSISSTLRSAPPTMPSVEHASCHWVHMLGRKPQNMYKCLHRNYWMDMMNIYHQR